ncbi:MAG TPA: porin [Thermoanaerobaculia bacterium]|jgi:hypothetical protein
MRSTVTVAALLFAFSVAAQQPAEKPAPPVTISGLMFGDYYYMARSHRADVEGKNGFWIRRAYLTFDKDLGDDFSARLRFEVNQPGDFTTNSTLQPFVKDAWVKWKRSPALEITAGLSPTPTWETVERVWGYRPVERTPGDFYRLGASRELGIGLAGALDARKRLRYHFTFGNGAGAGTETNEGKKAALAVSFAPTSETIFEAYGDREDRPGATDRTLLQAFGAVQKKGFRAGVQYMHQIRQGGPTIDVGSVFAVKNLRDDLAVLARVDRLFDPLPDGETTPYHPLSNRSEATLFIAGVDWKIHRYVSVIPNLEVVTYDEDVEIDVVPRLTFSLVF